MIALAHRPDHIVEFRSAPICLNVTRLARGIIKALSIPQRERLEAGKLPDDLLDLLMEAFMSMWINRIEPVPGIKTQGMNAFLNEALRETIKALAIEARR